MAKLNTRTRLKEMRERQDHELRADIEKLRKEFFDLRLKGATEAVANPARFREIRKDIARCETLLRERALGVRGQKALSPKTTGSK